MTIKTSDNKIPFQSVNYKGNIYIGAAIFEYDKNNVINSKDYYHKLNVSNENNYYKLYSSENVYYYNTTKVSFNLTANHSEKIKVKLEYGGNTEDIEKGKEYTFYNLTALYPYDFFVSATDGEVINAEVAIYDLDDKNKISYSFNVYEERNSPKRSIIQLQPSSAVKEKDYLKLNFIHYINHDF